VSSPGLRLTTIVFSFQMIVRVFADDVGEDEPLVTDVPVTPETTCRDVIECCRDPGDEHCALVEIWGSGHGEFCGYCYRIDRIGRRPLTFVTLLTAVRSIQLGGLWKQRQAFLVNWY
jgi:hypothetical protein